jgi:YebC/PmpR family DNA-binding regulatory protein
MSGHSKWATIKRAKGAADVKRGATFTKLSNAITLAVKQGGGVTDPNQNFRLRLAVDAAKASNMPKDTIERAIARAAGRDAQQFAELTYEGYGPGGVAVMVETATDNVNRTSGDIKGIFNKAGASFGQPGAVSYLFNVNGVIVVAKYAKRYYRAGDC